MLEASFVTGTPSSQRHWNTLRSLSDKQHWCTGCSQQRRVIRNPCVCSCHTDRQYLRKRGNQTSQESIPKQGARFCQSRASLTLTPETMSSSLMWSLCKQQHVSETGSTLFFSCAHSSSSCNLLERTEQYNLAPYQPIRYRHQTPSSAADCLFFASNLLCCLASHSPRHEWCCTYDLTVLK